MSLFRRNSKYQSIQGRGKVLDFGGVNSIKGGYNFYKVDIS